VPMTFVTKDRIGQGRVNSRRNKESERLIYSDESVSASNAFRLEIVTLRPSISSIPSAWSRERLRETSSRTVPMCDASSCCWRAM
jgi:hypothetical protein